MIVAEKEVINRKTAVEEIVELVVATIKINKVSHKHNSRIQATESIKKKSQLNKIN